MIFVDEMDVIHKVYAIAKEREAQGVKVAPLTRVVTHHIISLIMFVIVGTSPITPESDQPSYGVVAIMF